ncbi:MAG: DUF6231 family protein [Granulosicoccus sp.]
MDDKTRSIQAGSLGEYLCAEPSVQLLIVGTLPQSLLDSATTGTSIHRLDSLAAAEKLVVTSAAEQRQSDPIVPVLIMQLDPCEAQFERRLGRAVRACPHRVLLHCATTKANPGRADEEFFAFGFRKLPVVQDAGRAHTTTKWFEYRLSQYKPAPDWLNAQFWANPERYDIDDDSDDYYDEEE